jgi:PAS domain S-box-containing protein
LHKRKRNAGPRGSLRVLGDWAHTTEGLYIVDAQQRIVAWNKGAERILGHAEKDVLHRYCYEVVQGKLASGKLLCQPDCLVTRCVKRGSPPQTLDVHANTKEGRGIWLNITTVILPRKRGSLAVHLMRDTTCHHRIRDATDQIVRALRASGVLQTVNDEPDIFRCAPPSPSAAGPLTSLTRRELEVLHLVAEGLSNSAVAQRLGISLFTVRNHVQNILNKLALENKAQAVAYAFRSGLL